jgi:hypothetical protein
MTEAAPPTVLPVAAMAALRSGDGFGAGGAS